MNTYAEPAAVQRIVNVLAAVEFLHGHQTAMSLAERLAQEPKSSENSEPVAVQPQPEPEPQEPGELVIDYRDVPQRAFSALVEEGSVLRRKGDDTDYIVVQKEKHFAKVHKPFRKDNGEVNVVVNLARSHNWLLVGEVAS